MSAAPPVFVTFVLTCGVLSHRDLRFLRASVIQVPSACPRFRFFAIPRRACYNLSA
jgi:hypothetical protein